MTETIELRIRFVPLAEPPIGTVRDQDGIEQRFTGWLGLLHLLESHRPTPAATRTPPPAKEIA